MSYNMTCADTVKCNWIRDITEEFDVNFCAPQEHFKTVRTTEQWFRQKFCDYYTYTIPAYRLPGVDSGRGIGGLVQMTTRSLEGKRSRVQTTSRRLQAQLLAFPACKVLWINGYLPCDPQLQDFDDTELVATLNQVESLVTPHPECEVVWAAELNWDVSRENHFTRTVASVLDRLNLTSV